MKYKSRVTIKGQITIPKAIRERLQIGPHDVVGFEERGNAVVLKPVKRTILDFYGAIKVDGPQDFEAIREIVRAEVARRVAEEGR